MQLEIKWVIFATYILLNIVVTLIVAKRDDLEVGQKVGQSLLVWFIPFVATIGVWVFHRNEDKENARIESFAKSSRADSSVVNTFTGGGSD